MAFTWNQLLDFHIHLRRAAINQELVGGDARLLEIAEELLRAVETAAEDRAAEVERGEVAVKERIEEVNELAGKLHEAATILAQLDGGDYRHRRRGGQRLSDVAEFSDLVRLLQEYA